MIKYYRISDMSVTRADAIEKCMSSGKNFIKHFDKIYKSPNNSAVNHWVHEMQTWWNSVRQLRLKPDSNKLLDNQLYDWFFTAGGTFTDFVINTTYNEEDTYYIFVRKLLENNNVKMSLQSVNLIK